MSFDQEGSRATPGGEARETGKRMKRKGLGILEEV